VPIGDVQIPVIGKELVIPLLVVPHILIAAYIIGINLIAAISEFVGTITKRAYYDRFARNAAKMTLLFFGVGSAFAFTFILSLITLYPVLWSYLQNVFFWVLLAEAFMFVGEVLMVYAWYNAWDKMAYRKNLHVIFGFIAGLFGLAQMIFINVVASYMLTPSNAPATEVGWTFLNPTYMALNMHRFVGNFSYVGFLIAGWGAWRYLHSTTDEDREYYDWMGHWGIVWGFGFLLLQPFLGYAYMTEIKSSSPEAFRYLMLGAKSWLFNGLVIELLIMSVASVAYFVHKLSFAVKPMPALRNMTMGSLGFVALFGLLNVIPADLYLIPQIGLVFGEKVDPNISLAARPPIPLGAMYPYKYIGLIGLALVGVFALALYLKAAATGFYWGRASQWSQYALIACAITVVLTMMTMGYARETARRAGNGPDDGWLIYDCLTLQDQEFVSGGCPAHPRQTP
jgi:cytochrome bd ubiquinol oxidase subunit I